MNCRHIVLEFCRRDETAALARMSRDLIETGLGWSYRPERVARFLADPDAVTLVARVGSRVAGFAVMSFGDERAHLVLLAVVPEYRRHGIARRLVGWLVDSALTAGMASIHVELRADNDGAYAFYRALGFGEICRIPGYYRGRETALRMVRLLRQAGAAVAQWPPPAIGRP